MGKKLTRSVYLEGVLLKEGDEVTDEQAAKLSNPKLFAEATDATGPDANDAREFQQLVRDVGFDQALQSAAGSGRDNDPGKEQDTDDRAAAGAKLARGGKTGAGTASAPKATN